MSQHHEISVTRDGNAAVPQRPIPTMFTGDTVHYTSNDGRVRIEFEDGRSPFKEGTSITSDQIAHVEHPDNGIKFKCHCFIIPNDGGTEIGWTTDSANPKVSGADHEVPR
jgi:hypothetical protein